MQSLSLTGTWFITDNLCVKYGALVHPFLEWDLLILIPVALTIDYIPKIMLHFHFRLYFICLFS